MKEINLNKRGNYGSSKDKALTPTERGILEKKIDNDRDKVLFLVMVYAGLRVGEVEQLRFEWLKKVYDDKKDRQYLVIHIPNEAKNIRNKYKLWRPKTRRERYIYLFDSDIYNEIYFFLKTHNNFGISVRQIRNIVYSWGKILKKNISPHALRATCQNYWKYELDLKLEVISYMLGHINVKTTLSFYDTRDVAQVESYLLNIYKY